METSTPYSERLQRAVAHRSIDLAFETEAAAPTATLADFEELHVAVFGPGRLEHGAGLEAVDVGEPPLGHDRRRHGIDGDHALDQAVGAIADFVGVRHIDPGDRREAVQQAALALRGARLARLAVGGHDLAHHFLALPHHDEVHERGQRLRIGESADPAHQHDRILGLPVDRAGRQAGHAKQPHRIDVIAFVGHREADQIEVLEGALRFQREGRRLGPRVLVEVLGIGEEHALADDVRQRVQVVVDGLKSQVGHADGVGIGIDEGHRYAPSPVLAHHAFLAGDEGLSFLPEFPRHGASLSPEYSVGT